MKNFLIISLLLIITACSLTRPTGQIPPTQTQPALSNSTADTRAVGTSATATVSVQLTSVPAQPSPPPQNSSCVVNDASWSSMANNNTVSIIFTIADCKITVILLQGMINGQWLIFSDATDEPINGSEFNFQRTLSDQEKYSLSGTFTSSSTADIEMVIYKGFRFVVDQPSPLTEDLIINGIASP